ncbi:MAG: tetratricopeptide repeat protein [Bacteroidota bacterium]
MIALNSKKKLRLLLVLFLQLPILGSFGQPPAIPLPKIHARQISTENDSIQKLIAIGGKFMEERSDSLEIIAKRIISFSKGFPEYRAKGYSLLAYFNRTKYDYETSATNYAIAVDLYGAAGKPKEVLSAMLEQGKAYHFSKKCAAALDIFRQYNKKAIEAKDSIHIADSYMVIGLELGHLDSLESKLVAYRKALVVYDKLGDRKSKARLENNMASIYSDLKEYENARDYYERYVGTMRDFPKSELELSYGLSNLGNVFRELGDFKKAEKLLEEALGIKRRLQVMPTLTRTLNIMGKLYTQTREYDRAIELLDEALEIGQGLQDKELIYNTKLALGQAHLKQGNRTMAESHLLYALESVVMGSATDEDIHLLESLSELYQKKGEYKKALAYYSQASQINDSIQNLDRLASINKFKTQYEVKEKELEIANLKADQLLQTAELERKELERAILIATILLGSGIIFFLYQAFISRKRRNAQLLKARAELEDSNGQLRKNEEKLTKSNREKEVLLKEVHHRVKNNLQIVNSLLSIQARKSNEIGDINDFLYNSQNRLQSIALIHETLYASQSLAKVDLNEYLNKLSDYILDAGPGEDLAIDVEKSFEDSELDIQRVVPLGLIFSELLMNALKHAFPNDQGKLKLSFGRDKDAYVLKVVDSGTGFNENHKKSLGLELVQLLTEQLLGTLSFKSSNGTQAILKFPITYPV